MYRPNPAIAAGLDSREHVRRYPTPTCASLQPNPVIAIPPPSKHGPPSSQLSSKGSHSNRPNWSVQYNPEVDRTLEVILMCTITNERGAFCIKFSPDGRLLAVVASEGQVVTIYSVATAAKICQLEDLSVREDPPSTQDLSFSSSGKYLATCTEDPENIIRIWEVGKKHVRNVLKGHLGGIFCLDFSPDGRLLISGSDDKTIRIWNMRDGSSRVLHYSSSHICSIRFSPDRRHVAAGSTNADVFIWELPSGRLVASRMGHTKAVSSLVFLPNGEGLISGSWDMTLRYWDNSVSADNAKRKRNMTFVGNTAEILSVSITPHGQWIASGSFDCTVGIWNTRTGSQQCVLRSHAEKVYSVDFSPAGDYLASADWKGTVRIWGYKQV